MRRHDIDTIRVVALCLLILYHIVIGFQPWGIWINFVTNEQHIETLWKILELINIWRIPILFVVSGMGISFAMQRRKLHQLLLERTRRIFVPLIFGSIFIVPIFMAIFNEYYNRPQIYQPNPGHLWFLSNIYLYVILLSPIFYYLNKHPGNYLFQLLRHAITKPFIIIIAFSLPLIIESILLNVNADNYANFIIDEGWIHGLFIGMVCFVNGFVFVSLKDDFWHAVQKVKFLTLILAFMLYLGRIFDIDSSNSRILGNVLISFEAANWMLASFGLTAAYLNKPSKLLSYISPAVFPIYIVHMPIQFLFSSVIFPLNVSVVAKLVLVLTLTYGGSLFTYEIIKRLPWIRLLFGMKKSR